MRIPMLIIAALVWHTDLHAQAVERGVDLPTRPGVTQHVLLTEAPAAKAAVVLLAGGHGGAADPERWLPALG